MLDSLTALRAAMLLDDDEASGAAIDAMRCDGAAPKEIGAALIAACKYAQAVRDAAGTRPVPVLTGISGPRKPGSRPVSSRAAGHAAAAESLLGDLAASPHARAITSALLYVGAAIEDTAERMADDVDTVAAMLDDRLTSIEGAIDAVTAAPVPLYRRVRFRLRNRRARSRQEAGHSSGRLRPGP
jgi:hypothetical protein